MPPGESDALRLVGHIYDAAVQPARWQDLLVEFGAVYDAQLSLLFGFDALSNRITFAQRHGPAEILDLYNAHYVAQDVRMLAGASRAVKLAETEETLVSASELRRSSIYNEFLKLQDVPHMLGAMLRSTRTHVTLGISRSACVGPYTPSDIAFLNELLPHLKRAAEISSQLAGQARLSQLAVGALDQLPFAVFIVSSDAEVRVRNRAAGDLLSSHDGLHLRGRSLAAGRTSDSASLTRLIASCVRFRHDPQIDTGGTVNLSRPSGKRGLRALVIPVADPELWLETEQAAAVVFVFDPECAWEPPLETLMRAYGFTRAEARVVQHLTEGERLSVIAELLDISIHTARTQLKRALAKAGVSTQAQLVRDILLGPGFVRGNRATSRPLNAIASH